MKSHSSYLAILAFLSVFCIVISVPLQLYNDPAFLDAEIRRIRAGKAGELPVEALVNHSSEDYEESGDGDDEYSTSEEVDVTCAIGKGWHVRGQRCVQIDCPGGPDNRDFNTGECLQSGQVQIGGRFKPYSHWNSLNHVYRTNPAQRFLSRGMLSLLRRG